MIIVLKPLSPKEDIERVENMVKARGLDTHVIEGAEMTIIAVSVTHHVSTRNSSKVDPAVTRLCKCAGALQISKPRFPPGQLHHRCVRSQGWRR